MTARSNRVFPTLMCLAALFVSSMSILSAAQTVNSASANAADITHKADVLLFSDGGDDRTFGHTTTDTAGNFYVAAGFNSIRHQNGFGVLKYSAQGKLLGVFRLKTQNPSNGFAEDIKVDAQGNIYASGFTFPFGGLVMSFDRLGKPRWTRFIGDHDFSSLALDQSGNVYAGGNSAGAMIVAKLTTNGKLLWQKQHQGTFPGAGINHIQLDSKGNLVVIGDTNNLSGVLETTVLKLNPQGHILWTRNFSDFPTFTKVPQGGAVDLNDGIYATGTGIDLFTGETLPYTVKYDTDGNRVFALTGPGIGGRSIAIAPDGNILLHGAIFSQDRLIPTASKLDPSGNTLWDTQIPTVGILTNDPQGNVYIAGANLSVTKLNSAGKLLFSFTPRINQLQSVTGVTAAIVDPFGSLLATGFGPSNSGFMLDDIVTLKLPKNFKPGSNH